MKLSVLKRNQPIQEIDLGKDVLTHDSSETIFLIGRSKNCHIVLDDKKISREHAKIIHKDKKWFIEKTNPENICLINGDDFESHELKLGDIFTVENFTVTVMSEGSKENRDTKIINEIRESKTSQAPSNTQTSDLQFDEFEDSGGDVIIPPKETKKSVAAPAPKPKAVPAAEVSFDDGEIDTVDSSVRFDQNSTGEINLGEMQSNGIEEEVQFQAEPSDDLGLLEEGTTGLQGRSETDSNIVIAETQSIDAGMAESENTSYSLENIDSDDGDDGQTKVIQSFASVYLELFGQTAPYDRFIIEKEKTFIGRDASKCQIVLNDSEVSTVHAVITKNNIMLSLEDLNSSNGTIHKGDRINKVMLGHNDEFVIGGVTFTVKIRSEFLKEESATLMAVDENQTVEIEEVVEEQAEDGEHIDALGQMVSNEPQEKSIIKRILKDEKKRRLALYGLVALALFWFLSPDEAPVVKKPVDSKNKKSIQVVKTSNTSQKKLTDEQKRALSAIYEIGKAHYNGGRYREALTELQKIALIDPNFNPSLQSLIALSKEGLSKIEEAEKERQAKILAAERKAKVAVLLEKAREYTKERRVDLATSTFNDITQLEPENYEVSKLKLELEDWQREKKRKELEETQKEKEREDKVDKLKPLRTLYLQKEWFKAISKLEDFLRIKDMDDDLTTEATKMLKESREELNAAVSPLIGKAKSLLEGQDLKGAYEVYQQILRIEPSNAEALNQVGEIRDQLSNRARKIYREAIIAESLSLFQDAKEKFQEVQQISPVDSSYYKKATDKLKDYLE